MDRGIKRHVLDDLIPFNWEDRQGGRPDPHDEFMRSSMSENWARYGSAALEVYNVESLKQELKLRGLKVSGSHKQLSERLEDAFRQLNENKRQRTTDESAPPTGPHNYVFKFSMPRHKRHRVLSVPGDKSMETAFMSMLASMGFDGDHLYTIRLPDGRVLCSRFGSWDQTQVSAKRVKVSDAGLQAGDVLPVEYDGWPLALLVQKITAGQPDGKVTVLERKGENIKEYGSDDEESGDENGGGDDW